MSHRLNNRIADRLREMGDLLERQGERGFRSKAYKRASLVIEHLHQPVDDILAREGRDGLIALPAIGQGIASAIAEMAITGRWPALERLTGKLDPEALFMTLPGIGPQLAERLHADLHIETLEELEQALESGRVNSVPGFGPRRRAIVQAGLRDRLRSLRGQAFRGTLPGVRLLLEVDAEYREKARRNELKLIAPRRFNPRGLAWLPVMHAHMRGWHFTALYSNSARAHALRKSEDWVVIFAVEADGPDYQCTVVTEVRGTLKGRRVVRGREDECERFYEAAPQHAE